MCRGYKSEWIQHHSWVSRMQESKEASSGRWSKSAGNPAGGQQEMQVNFPKRLLLKALNDFFFFFCISYRVGSFPFPAVWIESLLLLGQSLGLHGVHPPLLILHFLPFVTKDDTDGSGVQRFKQEEKGFGLAIISCFLFSLFLNVEIM